MATVTEDENSLLTGITITGIVEGPTDAFDLWVNTLYTARYVLRNTSRGLAVDVAVITKMKEQANEANDLMDTQSEADHAPQTKSWANPFKMAVSVAIRKIH